MPKDFGPSAFFVSDKSIFDGLMQKKISKAKLLELLREKGIFLSNKVSRENIAIYVSRTFVDYYGCQKISSFLESGHKKEKLTSSIVETDIQKTELISACDSFKESMHQAGELCKISQQGGLTKVTVTYEEVDFSKTELRQRSTKTCEIEIESTDNGLVIRQPANSKASSFTNEIVEKISSLKGINLKPQSVSLLGFQNPESRSFFFERLIRSLEGYLLDDVIAVSINHKSPVSADLEMSIDEFGLSSEEEEDRDQVFTGYITKAVLDGTGVLESSEFQQLHKEGFFISRIVWTAVDRDLTNNKKVEFEALFKRPRIM